MEKGRFSYNHDLGYWVCTGCGYRITDEKMQFLKITPSCPNCDEKENAKSNIITQNDRINAMSIDEKAEFLSSHESLGNICKYCDFQFKDCSYGYINCKPAIKKWLESKVTDNDK